MGLDVAVGRLQDDVREESGVAEVGEGLGAVGDEGHHDVGLEVVYISTR